jgi:hypothetical protein
MFGMLNIKKSAKTEFSSWQTLFISYYMSSYFQYDRIYYVRIIHIDNRANDRNEFQKYLLFIHGKIIRTQLPQLAQLLVLVQKINKP